MIKSIFEDEKKIKDNIDPDEAVAKDSTRLVTKLEKKNKIDFNLQDIIPYNLGINIINNKIVGPQEIQNGDLKTPIINKNSKITCKGKFKNNFDKKLLNIKKIKYKSNAINAITVKYLIMTKIFIIISKIMSHIDERVMQNLNGDDMKNNLLNLKYGIQRDKKNIVH